MADKYCYHARNAKSFYIYTLFDQDIILCKKCERKLRRQILKQIKDEKEVTDYLKKIGVCD